MSCVGTHQLGDKRLGTQDRVAELELAAGANLLEDIRVHQALLKERKISSSSRGHGYGQREAWRSLYEVMSLTQDRNTAQKIVKIVRPSPFATRSPPTPPRLGSLAQDSSTISARFDVGWRDQLLNFEVGTRWGWSPRRRPKAGALDGILRERSESKGGGVRTTTRTWPRHHVVPRSMRVGRAQGAPRGHCAAQGM